MEPSGLCSRCGSLAYAHQVFGACPNCRSQAGVVPWHQLAPDIKARLVDPPGQPGQDKPGR